MVLDFYTRSPLEVSSIWAHLVEIRITEPAWARGGFQSWGTDGSRPWVRGWDLLWKLEPKVHDSACDSLNVDGSCNCDGPEWGT